MNLHDKRFIRNVEKPQEWKFCAIPNQYRAAQWKNSIDTSGCFVVLTSIAPVETRDGRPPRYETIRFRGRDPQELKETILKEFPNAVFTIGDPNAEADLKTAYWNECRAEEKRAQQKAADERFENLVVAEHRKIESGLTEAERDTATRESIGLFATDAEYSSREWVAWFAARPNFWSWPDNSFGNLNTLVRLCQTRGQRVPRKEEIASAMNYLLSHGHFYMKPTYKRSERDEFDAVKPFTREILPIEEITDNDVRRVVERLTAKYGLPVAVSLERLQAIGIPENKIQAVFERMQQMYNPQPIAKQSIEELKSGLQSLRNAARGGARRRQENMKGY